MRKFMSRAVVPILTAACMTFQTGTVWAAPTGPAQEALSQGRWEFGDGTWKYYDSSGAMAWKERCAPAGSGIRPDIGIF